MVTEYLNLSCFIFFWALVLYWCPNPACGLKVEMANPFWNEDFVFQKGLVANKQVACANARTLFVTNLWLVRNLLLGGDWVVHRGILRGVCPEL